MPSWGLAAVVGLDLVPALADVRGVLDNLAEVGLTVLTVLLRLTHVGMPHAIDGERRNGEAFGSPSELMLPEELPILVDSHLDLDTAHRQAVEDAVVVEECPLHPVKIEGGESDHNSLFQFEYRSVLSHLESPLKVILLVNFHALSEALNALYILSVLV